MGDLKEPRGFDKIIYLILIIYDGMIRRMLTQEECSPLMLLYEHCKCSYSKTGILILNIKIKEPRGVIQLIFDLKNYLFDSRMLNQEEIYFIVK